MSYWTVEKQWTGQTVAVLASGPSLTEADAEAVRHLPRIVTNATFRMVPDAELIYGSDARFWHAYADASKCPGLKVSVEAVRGVHPNTPSEVLILRNGGTEGFSEDPTTIRTGSNSGYAAVHIAALSGASRILLLGLDMHGGHWHGPHKHGLNNPRPNTFTRWIKRFDKLAPELTRRGIEVLNCSPASALTCFPKRSLKECLGYARPELASLSKESAGHLERHGAGEIHAASAVHHRESHP